jgi:hypothetical protein
MTTRTKKTHHADMPPETPQLHRPGQAVEHRDDQEARLAHARTLPVLRGSADPTPSTVQVAGLPPDTPLATAGVPPKETQVTVETGPVPPWLA